MVLFAHGKRVTQRTIAQHAKTDKKFGRSTHKETGTSPVNMLATLKSFGLKVRGGNRQTITAIKKALQKNQIAIVCFTERYYRWGHYAIVLRFRGKEIVLLDPDAPQGKDEPMSSKEFQERWKDVAFKTNRWAAFVEPREAK